MSVKFLRHEDISRWYHFSWDEDARKFYIKISKSHIRGMEFRDFRRIFEHIEFSELYLPLLDRLECVIGRKTFGINDSIVRVSDDTNWLVYEIKIPCTVKVTGLTCQRCDGTGKRPLYYTGYDEPCYHCNGSGEEKLIDYTEINQVCLSLNILLSVLAYPNEDAGASSIELHLYTLTTCCIQGSQGHSVEGYASPEFVRFLRDVLGGHTAHLKRVQVAMQYVHETLLGTVSKSQLYCFRCYIRSGQFCLSCPGNACEIHSENKSISTSRGDGITCHNLDSGVQQLTLLVGMACLSTLYDELCKKT